MFRMATEMQTNSDLTKSLNGMEDMSIILEKVHAEQIRWVADMKLQTWSFLSVLPLYFLETGITRYMACKYGLQHIVTLHDNDY